MAQASEENVIIKGTRKGLSITLGSGEWPELLRELDSRLTQADAFFRGSRVNLHTGKRDISPQQLQELVGVLQNHTIELVSLATASRATAEAAQAHEVRLALPDVSPTLGAHGHAEPEVSEGVLLHRTLRSGQSLRHPGHVVVIGDVNPGAEVIAGGDVVVWGKVRGLVHAGAMGADDALVCALELSPTQLRIGGHIASAPEEKKRKKPQPEVASVVDGQIVVEPWGGK
jgi:septum site-determining protein MinC